MGYVGKTKRRPKMPVATELYVISALTIEDLTIFRIIQKSVKFL